MYTCELMEVYNSFERRFMQNSCNNRGNVAMEAFLFSIVHSKAILFERQRHKYKARTPPSEASKQQRGRKRKSLHDNEPTEEADMQPVEFMETH